MRFKRPYYSEKRVASHSIKSPISSLRALFFRKSPENFLKATVAAVLSPRSLVEPCRLNWAPGTCRRRTHHSSNYTRLRRRHHRVKLVGCNFRGLFLVDSSTEFWAFLVRGCWKLMAVDELTKLHCFEIASTLWRMNVPERGFVRKTLF